jgi:hypothetical protein
MPVSTFLKEKKCGPFSIAVVRAVGRKLGLSCNVQYWPYVFDEKKGVKNNNTV